MRTDPDRCAHCGSLRIAQDPDVLDTWFSSWLWPFSTMGWPEPTPTLRRFYPTDVLVTGADIIFFWVARMVMAGYEFMGECPFHTVYFNAIVRDLHGRKMSKSLGNSPDPLQVIDAYGADALRFTVVALAPPGEDLRFAPEKTELGRNFANKIWNVARFALRPAEDAPGPPEAAPLSLPDRWVLSRLQTVIAETRAALETFRFQDAAMGLYRFLWHEFCDWYVEFSKLALYGGNADAARAARATLVFALDRLMRLLHPFMPFLSEEIWQALPIARPTRSVMVAPYPEPEPMWKNPEAEAAVARWVELVRAVRNLRSELGIPPAVSVRVRIATQDVTCIEQAEPYLRALARVGSLERLADGPRPVGEPFGTVEGIGEVYVPLQGVVDAAEVRGKMERDLKKVLAELQAVEAKLRRRDFLEKAPPDVVEKERQRAVQLSGRKEALHRHLQSISGGA